MSSPISRTDSPSHDDHAKRKRDETEALEKQAEGGLVSIHNTQPLPPYIGSDPRSEDCKNPITTQSQLRVSAQAKSVTDPDADAKAPKKIKPEVEGSSVSKAEVQQIQRNLKTMPLEDGQSPASGGHHTRDMDEVESDHGSPGDATPDESAMEESSQHPVAKLDTPEDTGSTPSSDIGDQEEPATTTALSTASGKNGTQAKSTLEDKAKTLSSSKPGRFNNTSALSSFANVKAGEN
ncbi:hypothetical protein BGZ65_011964, partial [Modicella reniformis]